MAWLTVLPASAGELEWKALMQSGKEAAEARDFNTASQAFSLALKEAEKFRPNDPRLADSREWLGATYIEQRKFKEGEQLFRQALAIRDAIVPPNDEDIIKNLCSLGAAVAHQGKYDTAAPIFQRAIDLMTKKYGENDPRVTLGLFNLGSLYLHTGDYAKAEPLLRKCIEILEKSGGTDNRNISHALVALGEVYIKQAKYDKAEPLLIRAVDITERSFPNSHYLASALNTLANLYLEQVLREMKREGIEVEPDKLTKIKVVTTRDLLCEKAEALYKRSLAVEQAATGPKSQPVARTYNNLGVLAAKRGNFTNAAKYYNQALAIFESESGKQEDVSFALINLGEVYRKQHDYAAGEIALNRALAILDHGDKFPYHPNLAACLTDLASIYADQKKYTEAETFQLRALAVDEKMLGKTSPNLCNSFDNLAAFYAKSGRQKEAEAMLKKSMAIREKHIQTNPLALAISLERYADFLRDQKRLDEAKPLSTRASRIREEIR